MTNKPVISVLVLLILVVFYMRSKTQEDYEFDDEVEQLEDVGMARLGGWNPFKWGKKKKVEEFKKIVKVEDKEVDSKSGTKTVVPPPEATKKAAYQEGKKVEAAAAAVAEAEEKFIVSQPVNIATVKPFQQSNSQSGRQITTVVSPVSGGEVQRPVSVATAISDVSGGKIVSSVASGVQTAEAFQPKLVTDKIVTSEAAFKPKMVTSEAVAFAPNMIADPVVSDPVVEATPRKGVVTPDKVVNDFEGMRKQSKLQVIATLLGL